MIPQISDACVQKKVLTTPADNTQLFIRAEETSAVYNEAGAFNNIPSPALDTSFTSPRGPVETGVTAIFVEAVYLSGQALPTTEIIEPGSFTEGALPPSASGIVSNGTITKHELSDLAKVAIGLGSGVVGSLFIFLAVFLTRRYRKRRLYDTGKHEMTASHSSESHTTEMSKPERTGNIRRTVLDRPRFQYELTAASSPTTPVFESSYLCRPDRDRLKDKELPRGLVPGERIRSEVPTVSGTTFYSANHFDFFVLDAQPQPLETEVSRKNNRASSQVLPWQAGIFDYLDPCNSTNKPTEGESENAS